MIQGAFLMTSESRCLSMNRRETTSSEENLKTDYDGERDPHSSNTRIDVMPNANKDVIVGDNEQLENIIRVMNSKIK